jgi:hypothetical protein
MSDDELSRYNGKNTPDTPDNATPYPSSRLAPAFDLVNIAREISLANNMVTQQTTAKLKVIANQIKLLQDEAHRILEQAQQDQELHLAECNFKKQAGRIYHLYRRADGRIYFSMLSPQEWGGKPPHEFQGSFRLEADMSWTPESRLNNPETDAVMIQRLLEKKGLD